MEGMEELGAGLVPDSLCWPSHKGKPVTTGNKTDLLNTAMLNGKLDFWYFKF